VGSGGLLSVLLVFARTSAYQPAREEGNSDVAPGKLLAVGVREEVLLPPLWVSRKRTLQSQ
jgi:hypothetical protein